MAILDVQRIDQGGGSLAQYRCSYRSSRDFVAGAVDRVFNVDLERSVLEAFCSHLAEVVHDSYHVRGDDGMDHLAELRGPGNLLYKMLFPRLDYYLPVLAGRLRETDELQIRTNDALIPWELVHDGDTFFGLKYALSYQTVVDTPFAAGRPLGAFRKALLVTDPRADLPESQGEAEQLADWLARHGATSTLLSGSQATLMRVLDELAFGGYDLLHYSGHVAVPEGSDQAALLLHGDDALGIRALTATLSGEEGSHGSAPPVVFINGCESAGRLSNLCSAFWATGSQIVVGTRYAVPEDSARRMAELFYVRLMASKPAGMAMRDARDLVSAGVDAAWGAFVLFGDPAARVFEPQEGVEAELSEQHEPVPEEDDSTPAPPVAPEVPPSSLPEELAAVLDDDARAAVERSAMTGVATSIHLLVAVVDAEDNPLREAVENAGIEPSHLVAELEPLIAGEPAEPGTAVQVSDSVGRVVAQAARLARSEDRDLATLADLGQVLFDDERGSSAKLLSAMGVRPAGPGLQDDRPESLFDDDGMLVERYLEAPARAALHAGRMIATTRGEMLGTYTAFLGFGVTGSGVLNAALTVQGDKGARLAARLEEADLPLALSQPLELSDVSSRTFTALDRARAAAIEAGAERVDDAAILRELLAEEDAAARQLVERNGIDPDELVAALGPERPADEP